MVDDESLMLHIPLPWVGDGHGVCRNFSLASSSAGVIFCLLAGLLYTVSWLAATHTLLFSLLGPKTGADFPMFYLFLLILSPLG